MEANHTLLCLTWQHALATRILILKLLCLKVSLKCLLCVCPINLEMMKWFSLKLWSVIRKKILWIETIYIHLNEQSCSFQKRTVFPARLETQTQLLQDKRLKAWSSPGTERPTGLEKGTKNIKGDCSDLFFFLPFFFLFHNIWSLPRSPSSWSFYYTRTWIFL